MPRPFLPPTPGLEQPFELSPKVAFRLALLGVVVLAAFAVLFFRLWSLQILSGPQYLQAARDNQLRTVPVEAARGTIVDRSGNILVDNVPGSAVQIWPAYLPKAAGARRAELRRLSKIVNVPVAAIVTEIGKRAGDPVDPVTVKESAHEDQIKYLEERQDQFPGVGIGQAYLRHYPYQSLAAQLLGYVGEISPSQLKQLRSKGYGPGAKIGEGGVEGQYDAYLRGQDGVAQLRVDSLGRPRSQLLVKQNYQAGQTLRLTLDIDLQRAAERALRYGIALAHQNGCTGCWAADGGAIVALDPRDGSLLAMASNPTYKPSVFAGRGDPTKLAPLLNPNVARHDNYPGLNRTTQGLYPAGSTFKPVTALAALEERVITPYDTLPCTGRIRIAKQWFKNWDPNVSQPMTLPTALAASCDT
ncbi:MAG: penicillin-binding transpeptidase domain-containing protein, partial [Gaiellaceae bacterium]